jgi:tetratricopeptide (TPR) repeat protein
MFSSFTKKKVTGVIGYYGLADWWLSTFTDKDRKRINTIYAHNDLTEGSILSLGASPTGYLTSMSGWFRLIEDQHIAYKLLEKAEALKDSASVLEKHFLYQVKVETYYKFGDIEVAKRACEQQISLAPQAIFEFKKEYPNQSLPTHVGFEQLAIILDKNGNQDEAIKICKQALEQGWGGDWESRIQRYNRKKSKTKAFEK